MPAMIDAVLAGREGAAFQLRELRHQAGIIQQAGAAGREQRQRIQINLAAITLIGLSCSNSKALAPIATWPTQLGLVGFVPNIGLEKLPSGLYFRGLPFATSRTLMHRRR